MGKWSSGIRLKSKSDRWDEHRIFITSRGGLYHTYYEGPLFGIGADETFLDGRIPEINTGEGEGNHIRIDLEEKTVTINEGKSYPLETRGLERGADVRLVASLYSGDGLEGYSTTVEGFRIWDD